MRLGTARPSLPPISRLRRRRRVPLHILIDIVLHLKLEPADLALLEQLKIPLCRASQNVSTSTPSPQHLSSG